MIYVHREPREGSPQTGRAMGWVGDGDRVYGQENRKAQYEVSIRQKETANPVTECALRQEQTKKVIKRQRI